MFTELEISNFRAIQKKVTVRFRPITVLIGRNSAGKSSIIKFLMMLRQTIESPSGAFLATEGEHAHLGVMSHLKNRKSRGRFLNFRIRAASMGHGGRRIGTVTKFQSPDSDGVARLEFSLPIPGEDGRQEENLSLFDYRCSVPYASNDQGQQKLEIESGGEVIASWSSDTSGQFLKFLPNPELVDSEDRAKEFARMLTDAVAYVALHDEFRSLRHISAIREEFQRTIVSGSIPPTFVGQRGEYTLPHLHRFFEDPSISGDAADFLKEHLGAVAGVGEITFRSALEGYMMMCEASNRSTGASSLLADFGFGVSQCLPVIVQAVLMRRDSTLLVEQPEAHLHPTAQLAMGSVFADIWNRRRVASIVETHSANLLLRLRKLVSQGKLDPLDISVAYFHVDKGAVSVRNLDIDESGNLEEGLPMEFFGADLMESLELRHGAHGR